MLHVLELCAKSSFTLSESPKRLETTHIEYQFKHNPTMREQGQELSPYLQRCLCISSIGPPIFPTFPVINMVMLKMKWMVKKRGW